MISLLVHKVNRKLSALRRRWAKTFRGFVRKQSHSVLPVSVLAGKPVWCRYLLECSSPDSLAMGRMYLSAHPKECDVSTLAAFVFSEFCEYETATSEVIAAALARKLKSDYENGNMVLLDEWWLALSEARVLALTSLLYAEPHK